MTEVIDSVHAKQYNECVRDFDSWLHSLATEPLPGGISAAALASAMGAALVAKAAHVTLQRQSVSGKDCPDLQAVLDLAHEQQQILTGLVKADERAYRAVLANRSHKNGSPAGDDAWHEATEVPLRVAEACHLLLGHLPRLLDLCWPPVEPDLRVGRWLLKVGLRAGLSAAQSNIRAWAGDKELVPLQTRMDALEHALETE